MSDEPGNVVNMQRRWTDREDSLADGTVSDHDLIQHVIESERRAAEAYREGIGARIQTLEEQATKAEENLNERVTALETFQRSVMRYVILGVGGFLSIVYLLEWIGPTVVREILRGLVD